MRFKDFTEEYKEYKCSDFLEFFSTNSLTWDDLDYESHLFYNVHYGLIHNGAPTLIDTNVYQLPGIKKFILKNYNLCQAGDVIFADASEDTLEICKPVEIINPQDKKIVSGLHTIHARDKKNITIPGYKGYLFSSFEFHKQVFRIAQGTKVYSINSSNFDELFVSIPSFKEQQKVVELLKLIDSRIETQNKIIKDLESLKKSIDYSLFNKKSDLVINNPSISIKEVLNERKKYSTKSNAYEHVTLSKDGIIPKSDRYNRDFLVKDDEKKYKITKLNDICYNPANLKFGVICKNNYGTAIFSPIYVTYEIVGDNEIGYIEHAIINELFIGHIRKYEEGTVYERMAVAPEDFVKGKIPIPNSLTQKKISDIYVNIEKKLELEYSLLEKYKEQKKYLLENMFI